MKKYKKTANLPNQTAAQSFPQSFELSNRVFKQAPNKQDKHLSDLANHIQAGNEENFWTLNRQEYNFYQDQIIQSNEVLNKPKAPSNL